MAVTAFPIIKIDSTDGAASDTACSGAGPATALTGTAATTDGAGTLVTLDGSPDLSGVATDGSHVLYYHDTTSGARRFAAINAVDNGAKTVTVEQALATSHAASTWGVGGVRATQFGSNSLVLMDNNSTAGDAMPGWTMEYQDGHAETWAGGKYVRRAGDTTDGPISFRGAEGATTKPLFTVTGNTHCFRTIYSYHTFSGFEVENTNATKTGSFAINFGSAGYGHCVHGVDVSVTNTGSTLHSGVSLSSSYGAVVSGCRMQGCTGEGIEATSVRGIRAIDNEICDCGNGIKISGVPQGGTYERNILCDNTTSGIVIDATLTSAGSTTAIMKNTITGNGGDGVRVVNASNGLSGMVIADNLIDNNGGYGIDFEAATLTELQAYGVWVDSNNFYSNTSGDVNPASIDRQSTTVDPQYTDAASDNYLPGNASLELTRAVGGSTSTFYPGAIQPAGGAGGLMRIGMGGGII